MVAPIPIEVLMFDRIKSTASRLSQGAPILVGVSGGVDSVVLAHSLAGLGADRIALAHFNHMLRGEAANEDAAFVRQLAHSLDVPVFVESADVAAYCRDAKVSIEAGARLLRHGFFDRVRRDHGFSLLALGHHADDRVETSLLNLLRGSGPRGMGGLREMDRGRGIIRPLLSWRKAEIVAAAIQAGLAWREDESNGEVFCDRNWLRNVIIPLLEGRRPGVVSVLLREAEQFQALHDFVAGQATDWLKGNGPDIPLPAFLSLPRIMQGEVLATLWDRLYGSRDGFEETRVREVLTWAKRCRNGSQCFFGPGYRLVNRNGLLGNVPLCA
jgi:tRNA(Ile)-lysidine synthase